MPSGRNTDFEGYLWMWLRLEEHDYVSFIGEGSGLNIVCIYPTSYILAPPNSGIFFIITGSKLLDKPVPPLNPHTLVAQFFQKMEDLSLSLLIKCSRGW